MTTDSIVSDTGHCGLLWKKHYTFKIIREKLLAILKLTLYMLWRHMMVYWKLYYLLSSALYENEFAASRSGRFNLRNVFHAAIKYKREWDQKRLKNK